MILAYISADGTRWAIAQGPRLETQGQRNLLTCIAVHFDANGHCFPSRATLAEAAGLSVRHITRLLNDLVRLGAIESHRRWGAANAYTACRWPIETVPGSSGSMTKRSQRQVSSPLRRCVNLSRGSDIRVAGPGPQCPGTGTPASLEKSRNIPTKGMRERTRTRVHPSTGRRPRQLSLWVLVKGPRTLRDFSHLVRRHCRASRQRGLRGRSPSRTWSGPRPMRRRSPLHPQRRRRRRPATSAAGRKS